MNDRIITRRDRRRYERHAAKQALTAAVRAVGGGDVDHWSEDTGGNATPVSGQNGGAWE